MKLSKEQQEYLDKVQQYFDNELLKYKALTKSQTDTMLIKYHTDAIESAKKRVIELQQKRLVDIARQKEMFTSDMILPRAIKSVNIMFNGNIDMTETCANIHYNSCIKAGLQVEKINLSSFLVSEDNGLD